MLYLISCQSRGTGILPVFHGLEAHATLLRVLIPIFSEAGSDSQ